VRDSTIACSRSSEVVHSFIEYITLYCWIAYIIISICRIVKCNKASPEREDEENPKTPNLKKEKGKEGKSKSEVYVLNEDENLKPQKFKIKFS
jgi:hypothetical protein